MPALDALYNVLINKNYWYHPIVRDQNFRASARFNLSLLENVT